jgi:hypothetical protein
MDVKNLEYPPKILLAWAEAIGGNGKIRDWLISNGYPELGIFTFALRNKEDARQWLMDKGFPHLMAMINACERNQRAIEWLTKHDFIILLHMGLAADGNEESFQWLRSNGHFEAAMIAKRMEVVKDEIEENNNDPHRISPD